MEEHPKGGISGVDPLRAIDLWTLRDIEAKWTMFPVDHDHLRELIELWLGGDEGSESCDYERRPSGGVFMTDAFDCWWQWVTKPVSSLETIPVEVYRAVMALPEAARQDRERVNEAVRQLLARNHD
jgi:hypothetical protein